MEAWCETELSGACRYRLVRRLGAGGMGEVHLAHQQGPSGFSRRVVLKRMLSHLADHPACREMFLEEARLTAQLDHPNIVKIIELGLHGGVPFFAMEYVPGPTLIEIVRAAPPPALAAYVAREVCRALGYAHGLCDGGGVPLGLVHRDVSPSNIMLTPSGGVKLLDFGIAKALTTQAATEAGVVKGKLGYMAPERLRGLPSDHRADLFSVGVVLHEALTGRSLFDDARPGIVLERMRTPLPAPSELAPDVLPALDEICLRALAERPEDRYASGEAMADALDAVLFEARFGAAQAAAFVERVWREASDEVPTAGVPAARDESPIGRAPAAIGSGERTAPAPAGRSAPAARPARHRRRRAAGVAAAAAGVAAAAIAAVIAWSSTRGFDPGERAPAAAPASAATAAWLSTGLGRMPAGEDAARWYREGVAELRLGNSLAASTALQKAVGAAPSHAPSRLALAQAWDAQGHDDRAEAEAVRALALARDLDDSERLPIDAYLHEVRGDWSRAIAIHEQLLARDPENLEVRLSLANAQRRAGYTRAAGATLDAAGARSQGDPRLALQRAKVAAITGDARAMLATAEAAGRAAHESRAPQLVAEARYLEGDAYRLLGDHRKALAAAEDARRAFTEAGNRYGIAKANNLVGACLWRPGSYDAALAAHEAERATYEELGLRTESTHALGNTATVLVRLGRVPEAIDRYQRALTVYREIGPPGAVRMTHAHLAAAHHHLGDLGAATKELEEAGAGADDDNRPLFAYIRTVAGRIHQGLGDLAAAQRNYDEVVATLRALGEERRLPATLVEQARLLVLLDRLPEARAALGAADAMLSRLGDEARLIVPGIARANLALAAGDPAEAERLARATVDYLAAQGGASGELGLAHTALGSALLALGRHGEARRELEHALAGAPAGMLPWSAQVARTILAARLDAAEGRPEAARRMLDEVIAQSRRGRYVELELEAALAELELEPPARGAAIRAPARVLQARAKSLGFTAFARRAGQLAGAPSGRDPGIEQSQSP